MTDHITLAENTDHGLRCQHCAGIYTPTLPATVERHISALRGFVLMHKHCPPKVVPSKQVELFDALAKKESAHETRAAAYLTTVVPPGGNWSQSAGIPAGIDGMSDEPDPETDPPGYVLPDEEETPEHDKPEMPDLFAELYPMARDCIVLRRELTDFALSPAQAVAVAAQCLPPVGTPAFDKIAHYSRCLKARDAGEIERQRTMGANANGLYVPMVPPMPKELRALLGNSATGKKKGSRPLTSGKRKGKGAEA